MADTSLILDGKGGILVPGATSGDDILTGGSSKPETFHIEGTETGNDTLSDFGKNDLLVVDVKIFDSNKDGIIEFGKNGVLDLDGPDASLDTITFTNDVSALRYLGTDGNGHFAYADASVRLAGFREGWLSNDVLTGQAKAENFFYDTALDVNWGQDTIRKFGADDRLVTTSKIFDGNGDNIINFDKNGKLDLSGSVELGHAGNQNQASPWGQVTIYDTSNTKVTELAYLSHETVNGVDYYYYGLVA